MKKLKLILKVFLGIVVFFVLYLLLAYLLPFISVNNDFKEDPDGVDLFVISNGVHTDICIPIQSTSIKWEDFLDYNSFQGEKNSFKYLSFGWGDKGFYLHTPTWADLTVKTAVTAVLLPSTTAMHISVYPGEPLQADKVRKLKISRKQLLKIEKFILKSFQQINKKAVIIKGYRYPELNDNFYEANGYYSLFKTCNSWTNQVLKEGGIKTALWSPFDTGILRHLPEKSRQ
ncbi:MAG: TIGR02117 family protein [Cyclobacteriaceae bacterium]|nr:TIGR02117 family protein [Cyclobacteriaceae bacterium]